MSGHYGGKIRIPAEKRTRFYELLASEFEAQRPILGCIPLPIVERRTEFYRLFHDIDVTHPTRDYVESVFLPSKLPAILKAHAELFGFYEIRAEVFVSVRPKGGAWKCGVHLYVTDGRGPDDDEWTPIIVNKELALHAVLQSRVELGEPLEVSSAETAESIIDACVHDENGMRIPLVAKSDQERSCPICFPGAEGPWILASSLEDLRRDAKCQVVRDWFPARDADDSTKHKFVAGVRAHALPNDCEATCSCRWAVWRHAHAIRSRHSPPSPCYQGRRIVLQSYHPRFRARWDCDDGMLLSEYDVGKALTNVDIRDLLETASIRTSASAPSVTPTTGLPHEAEIAEILRRKREHQKAKRKRTETAVREDGTTEPRERVERAAPELRSHLEKLARDASFIRAFPEYATRILEATNNPVAYTNTPDEKPPLMLVWPHLHLPCPLTRVAHNSNRPYMLVSGRAATLRCTDAECKTKVMNGNARWPGVHTTAIPIDVAGALDFSEKVTRYNIAPTASGFDAMAAVKRFREIRATRGGSISQTV